jgi:hypothetical protein
MPTDLQLQLEQCGHGRCDGLWPAERLAAVRQEAEELWQQQLSNSGNAAQLQRTGADPHGCEWRLSPKHPAIWALLTSGALPQLVAKATGWQALRPLHFGVLRKQPGAAMTSWHRDKDVIPSDAPILTCWIPFTPVQEGSGLYYAEGTARLEPQQGCLNDENELKPLLLRSGMPMTSTSAFHPGDVDLHNGVVWHCGLPNRMAEPRLALAACFIPDGARLNPDPIGFNPARGATLRRRIRELYFPQLAPGDPLQGEAHPLIRPS